MMMRKSTALNLMSQRVQTAGYIVFPAVGADVAAIEAESCMERQSVNHIAHFTNNTNSHLSALVSELYCTYIRRASHSICTNLSE